MNSIQSKGTYTCKADSDKTLNNPGWETNSWLLAF